jgi:hypothetical protein
MKRKSHRKLSLSLETLHLLDHEHLKEVAAGYNYSTSPNLCPTRSCQPPCTV